MKKPLNIIARMVAGWFFIVLGIAGLFLPILQGLLFLAVGLVLLAPIVPFVGRMRDALYRRFPRVEAAVKRLKKNYHEWKRPTEKTYKGRD